MNQVKEQDIRSEIMNKDNEDLDYIKKFSVITIGKACKKAGIDSSNLWAGRSSKKKIKEVRKILESEVAKLYLIKDEQDNIL